MRRTFLHLLRFDGPRDPRLMHLLDVGDGASGGGGGGGGGITNAFDAVQTITDADTPVASSATKNVTVVLLGLTANHAPPMPAAPNIGQRWTFVDGDGSLGSGFTWSIGGNGNTINGLASFVLAATSIGASPGGGIGPRGSLVIEFVGAEYKVIG
jgi:hypothetical protein